MSAISQYCDLSLTLSLQHVQERIYGQKVILLSYTYNFESR